MNNDELVEYGLKECPACYGTGEVPDSYNLTKNTSDICPTCEGSGYAQYTDEDAANDKENENIGNKEMMNDGD